MRKICTLEMLNCKISRGTMPPDPPSLLAPSALDAIWAGLTLNCFRQAGYVQSVKLTMILRILRTQKDVSFLSRKGCTSRIVSVFSFSFNNFIGTYCPKEVGHERDSRSHARYPPASVNRPQHRH